ncbi:MAG: hypothetical protein KIT18_10015, partial [Burkholderiales bacterium]|nr:hypothetical protein [Burkholderiales bacterium]
MHRLVFILFFVAANALAAAALDALEEARRLLDSGASRLVLNRVEQGQPRDTAAPRWVEWEALRLTLLLRTGRHDEVLQRVSVLPENVPAPHVRDFLILGARAALA